MSTKLCNLWSVRVSISSGVRIGPSMHPLISTQANRSWCIVQVTYLIGWPVDPTTLFTRPPHPIIQLSVHSSQGTGIQSPPLPLSSYTIKDGTIPSIPSSYRRGIEQTQILLLAGSLQHGPHRPSHRKSRVDSVPQHHRWLGPAGSS